MKDLPILFQGAMVRGILDDTKTQTRRGVKLERWMKNHQELTFDLEKAWKDDSFPQDGEYLHVPASDGTSWRLRCPYGSVGDRLWVKETFVPDDRISSKCHIERTMYRADDLQEDQQNRFRMFNGGKWKPSIFMPRHRSRILLEIVSVRVERLQDISRGDAMEEGCPFPNMAKGPDPRDWYMDLWENINGKGSWAKNPWVWVIGFKRA